MPARHQSAPHPKMGFLLKRHLLGPLAMIAIAALLLMLFAVIARGRPPLMGFINEAHRHALLLGDAVSPTEPVHAGAALDLCSWTPADRAASGGVQLDIFPCLGGRLSLANGVNLYAVRAAHADGSPWHPTGAQVAVAY